jgi:uncharacterized protein YcsI (UPF0317 family)
VVTHGSEFRASSTPLPRDVRAAIRAGIFTGATAGLCPSYAQANLVALPRECADDFLLFCRRNPRPCPLLGVTEAGAMAPIALAADTDLRTDLPRYRVYLHGLLVDEVTDATAHWRDDLVAFLLGCSFTFESPLIDGGIPMRHIEAGRNVSMYRSSIECVGAGIFHGPMVVSMRPIPAALVERATAISARFPLAHGAPIHAGDPSAIGVRDLFVPDYGDAPLIQPGDVPVFWACGVTPQAIALESKPELMITHSPGCMLITDLLREDGGA